MRGWRGVFVTLVVVVGCVALGYAAYTLAGYSWDNVVKYQSPYAKVPLAPSEAGSAMTSRTVLVIVDGLTLDASRQMSTLNRLRNYGSDVVLTAPQPSLSYPNWTTLLSGDPPYVSGVVTNWHKGAAPVETLFDTARRAGASCVFVGPKDFETLYGVAEKTDASFMREWQDKYLSGEYVDAALRLASRKPRLMVIHLPDVDEAGHRSGSASEDYRKTVARVDADLNRLVNGLQDGHTVFVIAADHGHIPTGGHGGWEPSVTQVPGVFAGPVARLGKAEAPSTDVAPTVAVLAGVAVPRSAVGAPIAAVVGDGSPTGIARASAQRMQALTSFAGTVYDIEFPGATPAGPLPKTAQAAERELADTQALALKRDRAARLTLALGGVAAALAVLFVVGLVSWRALVAALSGAFAYYVVYNGLFFSVHHYAWSLSAFNSEDLISAWMNGRIIEAAIASLVAVAAAGLVYPLLRQVPKGPRGRYLGGWLALGPVTSLVVLATIGLQVAWFYWAWGLTPTWRLPDLMWAFKYDLDLVQATAVGFAAVVAPLVTYLVGRYHPKVRRASEE